MSNNQHELIEAQDAAFPQFVRWCLRAMGVDVQPAAAGVYRLEVPQAGVAGESGAAHPYAHLAGRRIRFAADAAEGADDTVELVTVGSPFMTWLRGELAGPVLPLQAVAACQPLTVHELTSQLFAPYVVEGGHVHLAGCTLEDRPFLRLSFLGEANGATVPPLVHWFGAPDGTLVSDDLVDNLELHRLAVPTWRVPTLERAVVQQWINVVGQRCAARAGADTGTLLAVTVVWCRYAEGKLAFSIGTKSVDVNFGGWARLLADARVTPPPYTCPLTGLSSYRLTATEDGRITVAEAIATCAASGRRVLSQDLDCCAITGRRVLPTYLQTCPVSGRRALSSLFRTCPMCRQQVSPPSLEGDRCRACQRLAPITKADPRMARILGAFPKLDRWPTWKMAETQAVQILVGSSLWHRVLLVVDKQTLDVLHLAGGTRWSRRWTEATTVQRDEWTG